ncbi:MAG: hypothetical protein AB2385_04615 [Symbiobacterium sp.]|uniref:hypothetical protein n=1 Tax=Symbiobacterium sp. TaxID=1971213 RepID=UPI0034642582
MCAAHVSETGFLQQLAQAIRYAGGAAYEGERALALARTVWAELRDAGPDDFPHMVQHDDLRFVCQWDEQPPLMTVMLWDGEMWRDMARLVLPGEPQAREGGTR